MTVATEVVCKRSSVMPMCAILDGAVGKILTVMHDVGRVLAQGGHYEGEEEVVETLKTKAI